MSSEWIYYNELRKKSSRTEIIDFLHKGLQPYDANDDPVYCPDKYHKYFYLKNEKLPSGVPEIQKLLWKKGGRNPYEGQVFKLKKEILDDHVRWLKKIFQRAETRTELDKIVDEEPELSKAWRQDSPMKLSWKFVRQPADKTKKKELFSILRETKFYKKEFEVLLHKNTPNKFNNDEYIFLREGAKWFVKFAGQSTHVDHTDGIHYIAFLLDNPDKSYWTHDLNIAIKGHNPNPSPIKHTTENLTSSSCPEDQSIKITKNVYGRIDVAYRNLEKNKNLSKLVSYLSNRINRRHRTLCFNPKPDDNIKWTISL